ncbi:MAG: hypothetical protein OIN90_14630 [Candidatus Methanoperedens sp.]|nr:hypothetical protein [Candidatus Methanoperedens sp.]
MEAGKDYEIILAGAIGKSGITDAGGEGQVGTEIKNLSEKLKPQRTQRAQRFLNMSLCSL